MGAVGRVHCWSSFPRNLRACRGARASSPRPRAMTTALNSAAFAGDAAYSTPVLFREAWADVMTCPAKREWAFNQHRPSADELLLARDNHPFNKTFLLADAGDRPAFEAGAFNSRMEELFCATRLLVDGTYLGFTLNSACMDCGAPFFAPFESTFADHRLNVCRLICGVLAGRLYAMQFCWLKSGGLTVRFGPYLSLSTSKRNELRANYTVYAFSPCDVPMMSAMALCPGQPGEDFVNARFDRILLSDDWYMLQISDTYFQSSCVFCGSRGYAVCGCPLPMRRRCLGWAPEVIGYKVREGKSCWEELATAKMICANQGTIVFNVIKAPHSRHARVMGSGVFPFDITVHMNVDTSECLQKHLSLTGRAVNAMRTVLVPFSSNDSWKPRLMAPSSSVQGSAVPTPASSVDSKKPKSSLTSASSSDELISLIRGTCKRARVHGVAAQSTTSLSNTVASEEAGSSGDIETVTDTTSMIVTTLPPVMEMRRSNNQACSASTRRHTEVRSQGQAQAQVEPKVFPCPECGLHIKNKRYNLKRHIQVVHQKLRKFGCTLPNCEQRFPTKINLKRHLSKVHKLRKMVGVRDQRAGQEQRESQQTRQQAPMADNLYTMDNDGSGEQQTVLDTEFDVCNVGSFGQQEQLAPQQAMASTMFNAHNELRLEHALAVGEQEQFE